MEFDCIWIEIAMTIRAVRIHFAGMQNTEVYIRVDRGAPGGIICVRDVTPGTVLAVICGCHQVRGRVFQVMR